MVLGLKSCDSGFVLSSLYGEGVIQVILRLSDKCIWSDLENVLKFKRMRDKVYRVGGEERKINKCVKQYSNEICKEYKMRVLCIDMMVN